jgi:hypothetical protein
MGLSPKCCGGNPHFTRSSMPNQVKLFAKVQYINSSDEYRTASRHWDLYILFIERGLDLLQAKGRLSFIIPFSYGIQKYGQPSREILLRETKIESIADIRTVRVFGSVPVITIIPVIVKTSPRNNDQILVRIPDEESTQYEVHGFSDSHLVRQASLLTRFETMFRLDISREAESLIEKIESISLKFGEISYVNYGAQMSSKIKGQFGKDFVIRDKRPAIRSQEVEP